MVSLIMDLLLPGKFGQSLFMPSILAIPGILLIAWLVGWLVAWLLGCLLECFKEEEQTEKK